MQFAEFLTMLANVRRAFIGLQWLQLPEKLLDGEYHGCPTHALRRTAKKK
jgi:hypothetical protein